MERVSSCTSTTALGDLDHVIEFEDSKVHEGLPSVREEDCKLEEEEDHEGGHGHKDPPPTPLPDTDDEGDAALESKEDCSMDVGTGPSEGKEDGSAIDGSGGAGVQQVAVGVVMGKLAIPSLRLNTSPDGLQTAGGANGGSQGDQDSTRSTEAMPGTHRSPLASDLVPPLDIAAVARKGVPELPILAVLATAEEPSIRGAASGSGADGRLPTSLSAPRTTPDAGVPQASLPALGRSGYFGGGMSGAATAGGAFASLAQLGGEGRLTMSPITTRSSPVMPVRSARESRLQC
jgi:hypothetical protein